MGEQPITNDFLEENYTRHISRIAQQLKDLSKCKPSAAAVTEDMELEDVIDKLTTSLKSTQVIVDDSAVTIREEYELNRELKKIKDKAKGPELQAINLYLNGINATYEVDQLVALVKKQQREHVAIIEAAKTGINKAKRG